VLERVFAREWLGASSRGAPAGTARSNPRQDSYGFGGTSSRRRNSSIACTFSTSVKFGSVRTRSIFASMKARSASRSRSDVRVRRSNTLRRSAMSPPSGVGGLLSLIDRCFRAVSSRGRAARASCFLREGHRATADDTDTSPRAAHDFRGPIGDISRLRSAISRSIHWTGVRTTRSAVRPTPSGGTRRRQRPHVRPCR
jgi:hypothetical protein